MEKDELDKQFDFIRVFGAVMVILLHTTIMYSGVGVVTPKIPSEFFKFLSWYLASFLMELFIVLSGIIYGICLKRPIGYIGLSMIISKFKRLMIPYYLTGILYVAPIIIYFKITKERYLEYLIKGIFLAKNNRHLWYLLTLFDIFIFVNIFQFFITIEPKNVFFFIISVFLMIITRKVPDIFCFNRALYFLCFFCLGYLIYDKLEIINLYFSEHLSLWISLGFLSFPLSLYGRWVYNPGKAVRALAAVFFYFYLARILSQSWISNNFLFRILLKNSMGIYLIHPMLLYCMYFKYAQNEIKPFIMVFSTTIISIIISVIISELLRLFHLGFWLGEY